MVFVPVDAEVFLRDLTMEDSDSLMNIVDANASHFGSFIQIEAYRGECGAQKLISECKRAISEGRAIYLGIFFHQYLCGQIRIEVAEGNKENGGAVFGNVAYWISRPVMGNGIASRALRALIKFVLKNRVFTHMLTGFEAEIRCDNEASKSVVRKLGFIKVTDNGIRHHILDLVAPRATERWILEIDESSDKTIERGNAGHRQSLTRCETNTKLGSELISLMTLLLSELNDLDECTPECVISGDEIEKLKSISDSVEKSLAQLAPERLLGGGCEDRAIFQYRDFGGLWLDSDAGLIASGEYVVKGFKQTIVCDSNGCQEVGGFTLREVSGDFALFGVVNSTEQIKWERLTHENSSLLDGIWRTPRCYAGVVGQTLVTASNLWTISCCGPRVSLIISADCRMDLAQVSPSAITWKSVQPITRRKSRHNRKMDPIQWKREYRHKHSIVINKILLNSLSRIIQLQTDIRYIELTLLQELGFGGRGSTREITEFEIAKDSIIDVDTLENKHETLKLSLKLLRSQIQYLRLLSAKSAEAIEDTVDRISKGIECLLDYNFAMNVSVEDLVM